MLYTILIVVLIVLLLGGLPTMPWMGAYNWGYGPAGGVGIVLLILIILLVAGVLR